MAPHFIFPKLFEEISKNHLTFGQNGSMILM